MRLLNPIDKRALWLICYAFLLTLCVPGLVESVSGAALRAIPQSPAAGIAEGGPETEEPAADQSTALSSGSRAAGAMIFVLALIVTAMILLKRYMPYRFGPLGHKRRIQVLETVPIGDKRSLILVAIDGSGLLLAATPNNVSLLREIETDPNPGSALKSEAEPPGTNAAFKETLAAEIAGPVPGQASQLDRISLIREELEAR
jgi:flagellar biosynthetic protein FliO